MLRVVQVFAVALALAGVAVGCGSSGKTETVVQTVTVEEETADPAATACTGYDEGTPEYGNCIDANSNGATPAPASSVQEELDAAEDAVETCDTLGINPEGLNEGSCEYEDGTKVKVVNRGTELELPQMAVRLLGIDHATSIPVSYDNPIVGSFVVARVEITNRLDSPVEINASGMFTLLLGKKNYTPNSDAMIESDEGGPLVYETLQPGASATGIVIFDVKASQVKHLSTNGNLDVAQFSDADGFSQPTKRVGVIRTYN